MLEFGYTKHGDGWVTRDSEDDLSAAVGHILAVNVRDKTRDPETGRHPLAHAVARLLFVMERDLELMERNKNER